MKPIIPIDSPARFKSLIFDFMAMAVFTAATNQILVILVDELHGDTVNTPDGAQPYSMIWAVLTWATIFNKDILNGRSFGKRVAGMRVFEVKTMNVAGPFRCLIRNLFIIIWPIEILALLTNEERRIGDYVAGTKVQLSSEEMRMNSNDKLMAVVVFMVTCAALTSVTVLIN